MSNKRFLLILHLEFPEGIAPGAGSGYNRLHLARNGRGQPILRGSSLSGAIRHALDRRGKISNLNQLFGEAADDGDEGTPSRFKIADCVLDVGDSPLGSTRTHNLLDRHTKTAIPGALFTLESCPPNTRAVARLWFDSQGIDGFPVLQEIANLFNTGICLGGKSARGIGRAVLSEAAKFRVFDLDNLDHHASYLDMARSMSLQGSLGLAEGFEVLHPTASTSSTLQIKLSLRVPRGQDVLVADGRGSEYGLQPQCVTSADGVEYWRIPGSSLRGSVKTWMTKVAAKAGYAVADSYERRDRFNAMGGNLDAPTGENLGRAFLPEEKRAELQRHPARYKDIECPIAKLFGSLYQASRITISDSLVEKDKGGLTEQVRMHVAVDRITGGAAESMLFDNTVLVADQPAQLAFDFQITIRDPEREEVEWLRAALVALDLGVLRIGSSKSAGRLELAQSPEATGPHAELLVGLVPQHARKK